MPTYVTHTLMARDVYEKLKNKDSVSLDYLLTHSLGGDLCEHAKCRYDSHHKNQKEFFENMCDYLKENNLQDDPELLGILYGHICHYALDNTAHPLVRRVSGTCVRNKKNHGIIEFYYDTYLVKKRYGKPVNKYDNKVLFKGKINKKSAKMIDYFYEKTYNTKNVSIYYKINIWLYKKIRIEYKVVGLPLIKKVLHFNKFMKTNKKIDLLNHNHKIKFKDINGHDCSKDFDTLYKDSIKKALKDIDEINNYLKKN